MRRTTDVIEENAIIETFTPDTPALSNAATGISAAALQGKHFEPVRWVVPSLLVEGVTLLAAKPKRGKSYLALNCALAVASGGKALGSIACEAGDVLGLFLEDNQRRLQDRIRQLMPAGAPWPGRLALHTTWSRLDEGGLIELERWINTVPRPRLIIIDVLAAIRARSAGKETPYADDYAAIEGLRSLALKHRIAICVIVHCRKMASDGDPFDEVSGTTGLTGAASSTLVLKRGPSGSRADFIAGRGHDMPEFEIAVAFSRDTGLWSILGDADEYRGSQDERKILAALEGGPLSFREVAELVEGQPATINKRMQRMVAAGRLRRLERGKYRLP
jgi:predicted transcriptional regulator